MSMQPELVSFKLCPYVQRSVIVLLEKNVAFDIRYIDLNSPPDWFKAISPLGRVPLLKLGDTVLFESAVIMEYLDEVNPPSLHPADPLRKAHNRAWMEFSSELLVAQYRLIWQAADAGAFNEIKRELRAKLEMLEAHIQAPLFNGEAFSLADAAFAPFFFRLARMEQWQPMELLHNLPKTAAWAAQLGQRPSVKNSVVAEFDALYQAYVENSDGYAAEFFFP